MRLCAVLLGLATTLTAQYAPGPDSQRREGVPRGKVTKYTFEASKIFPGTTRSYWVYVPEQYDGSKPACVMFFQDGANFANETGAWRLPTVLDNLIQQGAMPVTIAILIDPGVRAAAGADQMARFNRSYEYDGLGTRYARFLIEEILPEVGKQYKLSADPNDRAIAGSSSGGIAAFTAAWERPDAFRRVLSFIGSYTNLRGGDGYIDLIRKMEPKPLRVFLQDGSSDLNIYSGSWWMANQAMAKSLEYAGYDVKFEPGTEAHNSRHGAAILPDALRWLWRDYPKPIVASKGAGGERHFITEILDPDHDWEVAADGLDFTEGPAVDRGGNVFFCDAGASRIHRIGADGKVTVFRQDTGAATGLAFGADGRLYAAENARKRVVSYAPDGRLTVLAAGVTPNDLTVTSKGDVYFTDTPAQRVYRIDAAGKSTVVFDGKRDGNILMPNGVRVNPDESLLVVTDTLGRTAWSFHIQADSTLEDGEPFYHLELPDDVASGPVRSGSDGMTFDNLGHLYIATKLGIQICDQPGRVVGIIRPPGTVDTSNVVFGGKDMKTLYATAGGKVYKRVLRRQGVLPGQVIKLPRPQL
ncbi:MAG TPA: SMP-30/gluconolactonase/LRE family protein [Candidatus Acidoferrales bacterium]|nr:SMP-30/gluconolactonase/LRE family protein [Candidatus Acidoferrales bacterium]